jgi:hypothetical protein
VKQETTWDSIPEDARIANIQLTYPYALERPDGTNYHPIINLPRYDRYFFFNEATSNLMFRGLTPERQSALELQCKVVGCIDDKSKTVLEVKLDKTGNIWFTRYPLKSLEERIKNGIFRKEGIKRGI